MSVTPSHQELQTGNVTSIDLAFIYSVVTVTFSSFSQPRFCQCKGPSKMPLQVAK